MRNLRVYMKELAENGDLAIVEEPVNNELEASAITAESYKGAGPALHFKKIEDFPDEFSLAGNLFGGPGNLYLHKRKYWDRVCTAMGLPATTTYSQLLGTCLERTSHPILPLRVESGPIKEVVEKDTDANVRTLPIPMLHKDDGGLYGNLLTMIVKDVDTDWTVWQNVRTMVVDDRRLVGHIPPNSSLGQVFAKYKALGRPMPFCLCIGGPPLVTITSFLPLGRGVDPASVAGGLNLDPIELLEAETNDLLVPSQAEVVIEGEVSPTEELEEGPFPEYWFYKPTEKSPVFHIKAITRRHDPIIPFSVDGVKPSDTHILQSLMLSYELYRRCLLVRNYPIMWIQMPVEFNLNVVVVSAPILFSGYVLWLSRYILSQSWQLGSLYNKVIVVDEKTPQISFEDIINDVILRIHPNKGYHFVEDMTIGPNARYATFEQRRTGVSSGMYLDTTWPKDWSKEDVPRRISIEGSFPKDLLDKVVENYNRLGFKETPVVYEEAVIPF